MSATQKRVPLHRTRLLPGETDPQRYATGGMRVKVLLRDGYMCRYCGAVLTMADANIDHIYPWKLGGRTIMHNLVAACRDCNSIKGNRVDVKPPQLGTDPFSDLRIQRTNELKREAKTQRAERKPLHRKYILTDDDLTALVPILKDMCSRPLSRPEGLLMRKLKRLATRHRFGG